MTNPLPLDQLAAMVDAAARQSEANPLSFSTGEVQRLVAALETIAFAVESIAADMASLNDRDSVWRAS